MPIRKFPKHFYDPIRIEIAVSQIQHDLRKLLPSLSEKKWKNVDRDITEWFAGDKFEIEPVHDFWNFFGSFSRSLKGKSLIYWVTAENVSWEKKDIAIDQIFITWDFPGLEFMGRAPYQASQVKKELAKDDRAQERETIKKDSNFRSDRYAPRDHFPVIVFHDDQGGVIGDDPGYYVLEGNRRTVRAISFQDKTISAYIGSFPDKEDKWPERYWLKTGILRDLIFQAIYYDREGDDKAFDIIRKYYQLLLRDFDVARIATIEKSFKNFETDNKLLQDLIMKDLFK